MKTLKDYEYYRTDLGVLYCGDCLEILPLIPDNSVDLVLTDPPYGIDYLSPRTDSHDKLRNDGLTEWLENMPKWLKEFKRVSTDFACCCCCCGGGGGGKTPVTAYFTLEAIKHFNLIQTVVWKKFIGLGWKYRPAYENIVVLSKNKDTVEATTKETIEILDTATERSQNPEAIDKASIILDILSLYIKNADIKIGMISTIYDARS